MIQRMKRNKTYKNKGLDVFWFQSYPLCDFLGGKPEK